MFSLDGGRVTQRHPSSGARKRILWDGHVEVRENYL